MLQEFSRFYDRYAETVFRVAMHITGDEMEAEDVCHDVFMEAMRKWDRFDPERGNVEAWLVVMAKSRSLDRLRRLSRLRIGNVAEEELTTMPEWNVEAAVVRRWERERLAEALMLIPEAQRRAIAGAYFAERTHTELAADMGKPLGTVKSLIRGGIRSLRKMLEEGPGEGPAGQAGAARSVGHAGTAGTAGPGRGERR